MPLSDYGPDRARNRTKRSNADSASGPSLLTIRLALAGLVFLVVGFFGLSQWSRNQVIPIDPLTLCATDRPPRALLAVLIDPSSRLAEAQKVRIHLELQRLIGQSPTLGAVDFFRVEPDVHGVVTPVARMCNPGSAESVNALYQNVALARKRWDYFQQRANTVVDGELERNEDAISPIFEAIQGVALRVFARSEYDQITYRRLVVVSDLIQNVPNGLNQYRESRSFEDFKRSPYFKKVGASLNGVDVSVLYLSRADSGVQGPQHKMFWEQWFKAMGASAYSVDIIQGDR